MRPSFKLLRLARPTKEQRLRSLIDLYHSSTPPASLSQHIDTELLNREVKTWPEPLGWSAVNDQFEAQGRQSSEGEQISQAKAMLGHTVAGTNEPGRKEWVEPRSKLMQARLLQIMDSLNGTSRGSNAGLEIVKSRRGDLSDYLGEESDEQLDADLAQQIRQ